LPPVVHVAGTNGKGSVIAIMRAVLEAAGHRAHVYTSPHLVRFAERIRLVGSLIDEALLLALLEHVEDANAGRPITFFEVTTAAAFMAFESIPADVVLLETGLGGRFDATNVIDNPLATVLTPISMDHMQYLGDTLTQIAGEKAAIMKPGRPCISAAQHPDAMDVITSVAAQVEAPLAVQGEAWDVSAATLGGGLTYKSTRHTWKAPAPSLPGYHQIENAGLALAALDAADFAIPSFALRSGMRNLDWPARAQRLKSGPLINALPAGWDLWLDGGHNAAAGHMTAQLAADQWTGAPLYLICGMLTSKAAVDYLRPLAARVASLTTVPVPSSDAAYAPADLAEQAKLAGLGNVLTASDVASALDSIVSCASDGRAHVLICGSLYLAGEVLKENG
jgi:dihydrofolate synthase/folylpolyglutamate synthase